MTVAKDPKKAKSGTDANAPANSDPPPQSNAAGGKASETSVDEPDFPVKELYELEALVNKTKWVVPVMPGQQLEVLLRASTALAKQGMCGAFNAHKKSASGVMYVRPGSVRTCFRSLGRTVVMQYCYQIVGSTLALVYQSEVFVFLIISLGTGTTF